MRWFAVVFFLMLSSCFNRERYISATELWSIIQSSGEEVELVPIPVSEAHRRVVCSDYDAPGCVPSSGKRVKVRMVEFLAIQFETESYARFAAFKYNQYYAANWLFDEVTNEPVVEDFLKKTFGAVNPKQESK